MSTAVKIGDTIRLHYKISTAHGEEIMSTFTGEPVDVKLGHNQLAPGLEKYLISAEPQRRYVFSLEPGEAFGHRDPGLVQKIPASEFSKNVLLEQDKLVEFSLPNGDIVTGTLVEKTAEYVVIDFNHPLVDCAIQFEFEIMYFGET